MPGSHLQKIQIWLIWDAAETLGFLRVQLVRCEANLKNHSVIQQCLDILSLSLSRPHTHLPRKKTSTNFHALLERKSKTSKLIFHYNTPGKSVGEKATV